MKKWLQSPEYKGQDIHMEDIHMVACCEQLYPDKMYATVKVKKLHDIKLKIDTEADACVITTAGLQDLPFPR